jgi:ParB-like chromosome segregation protein Spo0J
MKRKTPVDSSAKTGSVTVAEPQRKRAGGHPRASLTPLKAQSGPETRLGQFSANPRNPRKISDEQLEALKQAMRAYGDLSGLVVNLNTGHLVGGHQRVKILGNLPVEITRRFPKPTGRGTVAEGVVIYNGERFVYREVRWTEQQERAAMIAANKHGGDWDLPGLSEILMELDSEGYDLPLTGFSAKELEKMLTKMTPDTDGEGGLVDVPPEVLPAHVRMVQLFLTVDTLPRFMEQVQALGKTFKIANVTDTVVRAVDECYKVAHGDTQTSSQPESPNGAETGLSPKAARPRKAAKVKAGGAH